MREPPTVAGCLSIPFSERAIRNIPASRWPAREQAPSVMKAMEVIPVADGISVSVQVGHRNEGSYVLHATCQLKLYQQGFSTHTCRLLRVSSLFLLRRTAGREDTGMVRWQRSNLAMLRVGALAVACPVCFRISLERGELVMSTAECPLIVGREGCGTVWRS
jgi:hypothetical protein